MRIIGNFENCILIKIINKNILEIFWNEYFVYWELTIKLKIFILWFDLSLDQIAYKGF